LRFEGENDEGGQNEDVEEEGEEEYSDDARGKGEEEVGSPFPG